MKIKIEGIKPHEIYSGEKIIELLREAGVEIEPEVRKYDWSKTLDDVLVYDDEGHIFPHDCAKPRGFYTGWQPNIHGKCPVDGEAAWVRVRQCDGQDYEDLAKNFNWDVDIDYRWQFIRLAEGYVW